MSRSLGFMLAIVAIVAAVPNTSLAVPNIISYQGVLNGDDGTPVNGSVNMTFSIYDSPSSGAPLWVENQTVSVSNGAFNVLLGSVEGLPADLFLEDIRYLGIKVGADDEMTPRQQITSTAYSHRSELLSPPTMAPIGSIVAWAKSMPGTPPLPSQWVECNGQTLSDSASPFDGATIPDLNGLSGTPRFLRGGAASGSTGGTESHTHSLNWYGYAGGSGSAQRWLNTSQDVSQTSTLPSYYSVVWIMRIK